MGRIFAEFKNGVIVNGDYKGYRVSLIKIDNNFTLHIFTKEKLETKHFDTLEELNQTLKISWDNIVERRKLENEIIEWWIEQFPICKESLLENIKLYSSDEEIGLYNLISYGLLSIFYEKNMETDEELFKEFLKIYNKFLEVFSSKYQFNAINELEEMTCVEMFEWLDNNQKLFVKKSMPEGKLKDLYIEYFDNLEK